MAINLNTTDTVWAATANAVLTVNPNTTTQWKSVPYTVGSDTITFGSGTIKTDPYYDDLNKLMARAGSSTTLTMPKQETNMKKTIYADYTLYLYDLSTDGGRRADRLAGKFEGQIEIDYNQDINKVVLLKHAAEIAKLPNAEKLTTAIKTHNSFNLEYTTEK
jgi:hypothetical protein